jgi:WD40 repeat protein
VEQRGEGASTILSRGAGVDTAAGGPVLDPGAVVAGYVVEALAGSGGMGVVYRATDTELGRQVALKLIAPARAGDPRFRELFVRESLVAAGLEHPNVIPIYRAGEDEGRLYIAMRYVEGASLDDLIAERGRIPPGRAARVVARVADALDAAHARGLVHRDVKPANVLIADPDGEEHVYLTDFGLAAGMSADREGAAGGWAGTLAYLAPEQIRGGAIDARTDVYALGCVLFHALAGRPPFPAGDEAAALEAHLTQAPPRLSDAAPGLPPAMDEVVRRAMAKRPEDRFPSAGEMGRAALAARYDVAILRAEADAAPAREIAGRLAEAGLQPVIPEGGTPREAAEGVGASSACLVLVGREGLGEWARDGLAAATEISGRDRAFRTVLVLLPGGPDPVDPSLVFLATHPWIDLRAGVADPHGAEDLVRVLRGADVGPGLAEATDACPYRGLEAFREEDADLFFGREDDVARLVERLRTSRFLAVLGPSGSGKSSLVAAGLLPAVRRGALPGGDSWRVLEMAPGAHPLAALAARLAHLPGAGSPSVGDLAADERRLDLAVARALDGRPAPTRALLVVDQLEEAFTLCQDEGERAAFLANLVYAASIPGGRTVVVVAMRADFYGRLAEHPEVRALAAAQQVLLGPMDARGLRRAIELPAKRAGLELEPGLTRRILTDVADRPGTLPLMEHLLVEVWQRRRGRTLTLEAYAASGGVEGALARRANSIYGAMDPERQAVARRVLLRLTQPGEGTEDTRRRATRAELVTRPGEEGEVDAVIAALADARLVTTGTDEATGEPVVDVTHEALIRGWPELRGWINDDREQLRLHRRLSDAAGEWEAAGRDEGQLYRGAPLALWDGRDESHLNELERGFLAASRERVEQERASRRKRTRITIGALAVGLAIVAALGILALVSRNDAADQRDLATSRQLAGSSALARERDSELATLLGERAYAAAPTAEAEETLRQGVHDSKLRAALRLPDDVPQFADLGAPGRIAIMSQSGTFRLWDSVNDPRGASPVVVGKAGEGYTAIAAVSTGYVTGGEDGVLRLWPGQDAPGDARRLARVPGAVIDMHAASDGDGVIVATDQGAFVVSATDGRVQRVATGSLFDAVAEPTPGRYITAGLDGTLQRWSAGSSSPTPIELDGAPWALSLSPDGELLAVAGDNGLHVLRLGEGGGVAFAATASGPVADVAWSADGERLVAGASDASVRVYSRSGRLLSRMEGHEGTAAPVGWDGSDAVWTASSDGSVRRWDPSAGVEQQLNGRTPAPIGGIAYDGGSRVTLVGADGSGESWRPGAPGARQLLPPVSGNVWSAAAQGDLIAVGIQGGPLVVRDRTGAEVASASFPNQQQANGLALDPGGRQVAAALSDGRIVVMDVTRGAEPRTLGSHEGQATAVAFSPDGETIASGGADGAVRVWGGPGGSRTIGSHDGSVDGLAFSPDGRWLASASGDKTVRIWDLSGEEQPRILRSSQGPVRSVAFVDADRLVSGGTDGVRVTDWRRGVTLLTIPRDARAVTTSGEAPAIAYYGDDNVIREIECDVCGPIGDVETMAEERTTRDLTEAEQADFHAQD